MVAIYRRQFPALYEAASRRELRSSTGAALDLGGDTLITYKLAIRKIFGKYFGQLDPAGQKYVRLVLSRYSITQHKRILCFNEASKEVVNNHQIGNMMPLPKGPFPAGQQSLNVIRAQLGIYDYFDRFLHEVRNYYERGSAFEPVSTLQKAIAFCRGYFDFFGTYERFIEDNLLQDFLGKDLWSISDFEEYVKVANEIIDKRGLRFTAIDS